LIAVDILPMFLVISVVEMRARYVMIMVLQTYGFAQMHLNMCGLVELSSHDGGARGFVLGRDTREGFLDLGIDAVDVTTVSPLLERQIVSL
jgi:hypothetical protein